MLVVNLFAGPGAGKSTTACGLFYLLKLAGINCEYVHEEAKEFTWEKRSTTLACQPYIFGKQMRNVWRLKGQVDVAICDSPILLSNIYAGDEWPESFKKYVVDQFNEFDNLNFFLVRNNPYNPSGRNQIEEQAKDLDLCINRMLDLYNIEYRQVLTTPALAIELQEIVEKELTRR